MKKTDFKKFPVGMVFNNCALIGEPSLKVEKIVIDYPSRLEAMALDPGKIADNDNLVYRAGQIDITVPLFKRVTVSLLEGQEIKVSAGTSRPALVRHAAMLMRHALNTTQGFRIDVSDEINLRHCGLGSSSSLIAGVACAINEMYGKPIGAQDLVKYLAQNHGEEIDDDPDNLTPVQCIGGSAVCGNFDGGLIILAGEATPITQIDIPSDYAVVIGVAKDYKHPDAEQLMQSEVDNMDGFMKTGEQYGQEIAYRLIHEVMPGLMHGSLQAAGKLIFDYRWNMGSIQNCSFVFPRMLEIADDLREFYEQGCCEILALSSVGPGFFAVTKEPNKAMARFEANNMRTITTTVHNGTYIVVERQFK